MLAAVYIMDESRPWLGEVKGMDVKELQIHWYEGSYQTSWGPMKGKYSLSSVHRESLLLWGFHLTEKTNHLKRETQQELQRLYLETDEKLTLQRQRRCDD